MGGGGSVFHYEEKVPFSFTHPPCRGAGQGTGREGGKEGEKKTPSQNPRVSPTSIVDVGIMLVEGLADCTGVCPWFAPRRSLCDRAYLKRGATDEWFIEAEWGQKRDAPVEAMHNCS
eukprot:Hpha_TRINITY_DN15726_c1_g1::TRINITY_DN15726_c1_g1_i2::g.40233::m.40233